MSSALVVADAAAAAGNGAARAPEEDAELPVDLSQLPMIPMPKSLLLINNFVANTTRFLNHFAFECEDRIARVSSNLTRVEVMLAILEAKLNSIPDLSVTDAEVEAAGRSMAGGDSVSASSAAQVDIGISDQDLPSMDAGAGGPLPPPPPPPPPAEDGAMVVLPPPPPPPESVNGDGEGAIVVAPPPPPPGLGDGEDDSGPVAPPDLPPPPSVEAEPTFLKLKDDPVYAKYFTMRRLGIPDQVIEHKLLMDGMDTAILTMDPEGPSPSGGSAPTASEPSGPVLPIMAPPSVMSDSDDDSDDEGGLPPPPPPPPASVAASRPPSGNIGLPFPPPPPPISPTSSVSSRPESLFGGLPPPPPPGTVGLPPPPLPPFDPDDDDSSSDDDIEEIVADPPPSQPGFLKLKDDPAFSKYFKMRKLGMPDGVIQHKLMMDGVTVDILSMDPEGPSPNAAGGSTPASAPEPAAAPPSALPPPPLPPAGRPGLPPPPIPKYNGSDDDSDFSD